MSVLSGWLLACAIGHPPEVPGENFKESLGRIIIKRKLALRVKNLLYGVAAS